MFVLSCRIMPRRRVMMLCNATLEACQTQIQDAKPTKKGTTNQKTTNIKNRTGSLRYRLLSEILPAYQLVLRSIDLNLCMHTHIFFVFQASLPSVPWFEGHPEPGSACSHAWVCDLIRHLEPQAEIWKGAAACFESIQMRLRCSLPWRGALHWFVSM